MYIRCCVTMLRSLRVLLLLMVLPGRLLQVIVNRRVSAWLGSDVTLKCTAQTTDQVTQITWQRKIRGNTEDFLTYNKGSPPRHLTPFAQRVKLLSEEDTKNGSISIQSVTLADEGTYVCIFTIFPGGATEAEIMLQVWVVPAVHVTLKPVNASQCPGMVAECLVASAKPLAMITWITDRIEYSSEENTTRQSDGTMDGRSKLYLTPTPALHGQEVACHVYQPDVAFAEQRNVTVNVTLTNIQYAPQTVHTEVRRRDDGLLQLACQCKASPSATYMWRRGNISISMDSFRVTSGTLNLSKTDDGDINGLYFCEAANIVGANIGSIYLYRESRRCRELLLVLIVFLLIAACVGFWILYCRYRQLFDICTKQKHEEDPDRREERQTRTGYPSPTKQQPGDEMDSLQKPYLRKDIRTTSAIPGHGEAFAEL